MKEEAYNSMDPEEKARMVKADLVNANWVAKDNELTNADYELWELAFLDKDSDCEDDSCSIRGGKKTHRRKHKKSAKKNKTKRTKKSKKSKKSRKNKSKRK